MKDGLSGNDMERTSGCSGFQGSALQRALTILLNEDAIDGVACARAQRLHGIRSVEVPAPQFSIVVEGRKHLLDEGSGLEFWPGDVLVMATGARMDLIHHPDARRARYQALVVPLCEEVLAAARLVWGVPVTGTGRRIGRFRSLDHAHVLRAWAEALAQGDYTGARAALVALVVAWCQAGMTALLAPPVQTLAQRIRGLVRERPAHPWQSSDIEQALGLSGATLRRRLAAEGGHFRHLLSETRLACALELLYTTNLPIKTVAARVGYQSPDGFVRAFKQRYGLNPADIGNVPD
ncbi:MAG: AraC family transcriptional regulator [Lautropia sp.]|nr:AraC family transcriptional regulator [Lautropia sp.]